MIKNKFVLLGTLFVFSAIFLIGLFFVARDYGTPASFVIQKESMQKALIAEGKYRCCLKKPCLYCLEHGECDCLDRVVNGKAPCGECLGGILEGEGNPFLVQYFASAAAAELGEQHLGTLKNIISEKYNMKIE